MRSTAKNALRRIYRLALMADHIPIGLRITDSMTTIFIKGYMMVIKEEKKWKNLQFV